MARKNVRLVPVGLLKVDPRYQAALVQNRAIRIAMEFNPAALGFLTVSLRADGFYYIIDGQHRFEAILLLVDEAPKRLWCDVKEGLSLAEEAELFCRLNDARKPTAIARFRAAVVAGDSEAKDINRIIKKNGWELDASKKAGRFCAVTAAQKVYNGFRAKKSPNPELLDMTLSTLARAWGVDDTNSSSSVAVRGVGYVFARYNGRVDKDRLATQLAKHGSPAMFLGAVKGARSLVTGDTTSAAAEVVIAQYNSGLKSSNRLPSLRDGGE